MKKILCLALSAALIFSLCGCSFYMRTMNSATQKAPDNSVLVPSVDNIGDNVEVIGLNKTVVCPMEDSMYPAANLELKEDFSFKMTVNLYDGFGDVLGTYETEDNGDINLTVTEKTFEGYSGDTLESFKLIKEDDTSYKIKLFGAEQIGALHDGAILAEE